MGRIIIFTIIIALVSLGFLKFVQKRSMRPSEKASEHKTFSQGLHEFYIPHGGLDRRYLAYLPASYDHSRTTPVIVNLHGAGGNAESNISMSGMNETAEKYGFIVVYPEGTGTKLLGKTIAAWNTGMDERIADVDDVGFITAIIEKVKIDLRADPARIYATGISNGAQMAYRLACERSDVFAAIAPIAAQGVFRECNPQRPVPVIHFHGTDDPCALYDGGVCGGCIQKYFKETIGIDIRQVQLQCEPVPEHIKKWVAMNRVQDQTPHTVFENSSAQCVAYGKGDPGEVVLCTVKNMGHTWPGGSYGTPCEGGYDTKKCKTWISIVGNLNADISANELMWDFFKNHQLPEKSVKDRI